MPNNQVDIQAGIDLSTTGDFVERFDEVAYDDGSLDLILDMDDSTIVPFGDVGTIPIIPSDVVPAIEDFPDNLVTGSMTAFTFGELGTLASSVTDQGMPALNSLAEKRAQLP